MNSDPISSDRDVRKEGMKGGGPLLESEIDKFNRGSTSSNRVQLIPLSTFPGW
jgi:hypothetical protein